ncbi:MAG TPA: 50S ribosomal protein L6 [Gammaproteobacteria bacterium]|nr:50S ribosomal protein L6 [Gammaproteobacteria bacterium]
MSRVGRKPVTVPAGVEIKMQGQQLSVKGPKGHLSANVHPFVRVTIENSEIKIHPNAERNQNITGLRKKLYRSIAGTTRANIYNLVHGVTQGFECKLILIGVGYRAQSKGKTLSLSLGFSHPTDFSVPEGVTIETPSQTEIIIKGMDKQKVGQVAASIRKIRGPEPYKGKGVRYAGEVVVLKETKKK